MSKKEFTLSEWQERIRNGQRFQEKFAKSNEWARFKKYYRHEFGGGIIPVNLVFSLMRSMVPQVYFRNPKVSITARKPGLEAELNARLVQKIDNWLLQELLVKKEIKKMIADAFLAGIAAGFIGYDSQYGYDPENFATEQLSLTQFDKDGNALEYTEQINPGMPWFLRARPEDVIWPWGCESAESAEWVALRVFRPLEDVKADKKYANTKDLTGSYVVQRSQPEGAYKPEIEVLGLEETKNRQWVEIFQVHDKRTGKIYAFTMDHTKFLRNQPDELQIEGLPVETLVFNEDPDYIYGIPDARIIEPQQLELNEIRTQAMRHRRIDIVKAISKKGVFTKDELSKMTDEKVMAIVEADTEGALSDSIMSFTPTASGVLADLAAAGELVRSDVREMVGFSRVAQGNYQGKTHVSAEETKKVFQAMNIRLDERRDAVADLLTKILRKFNQIIFTKWDQDRVSKIIGPDGADWWLKYSGQQLREEYDLLVTPEEGQSMDSGTKFEMAMRAAEAYSKMNAGAIAQGAPIPPEIQKLVFTQFEASGLDIDKLLAQTKSSSDQAQQAQLAAMGGKGQGGAVSPGLAASAMGNQ